MSATINQEVIEKEPLPPGDLAIWIFIFAELAVFGVLFLVYAFARSNNVELFNSSQELVDRTSGAINTIVLITSSLFAVRSVTAIRDGDAKSCGHWLLATIGMGGVLVIIKIFEFQAKFDAGIGLSTNLFFTFYLSMTAFHFMHVILGMIILAAVYLKARRGGYSATEHTGVETGVSYWHMVDLVWIILFPLVYIIR